MDWALEMFPGIPSIEVLGISLSIDWKVEKYLSTDSVLDVFEY